MVRLFALMELFAAALALVLATAPANAVSAASALVTAPCNPTESDRAHDGQGHDCVFSCAPMCPAVSPSAPPAVFPLPRQAQISQIGDPNMLFAAHIGPEPPPPRNG